jgi:hypothetical protein
MTKLEDMIEEVLLNLEGFVGDQDVYGTLSDDLTTSTMEFVVNGATYPDGSGFSTGMVEIGTELVYVQEIDRTTGEFSGVLRGFRGTTPVAWPAGTLMRNNPRFPRHAVIRAINDTIKSLYPKLFAVKKREITIQGSVTQYDMPADTLGILSVQILMPGASKLWVRSSRWSFDTTGGSNTATGKAINIFDAASGRPVQIVYTAEPSALEIGDDFTAITGLPDWIRETVIFGACWRLSSFVDSARVAATSAEQTLLQGQSQVGSGTNLAKYFLGMFQQRLLESEARIKREYPAQRHYNY